MAVVLLDTRQNDHSWIGYRSIWLTDDSSRTLGPTVSRTVFRFGSNGCRFASTRHRNVFMRVWNAATSGACYTRRSLRSQNHRGTFDPAGALPDIPDQALNREPRRFHRRAGERHPHRSSDGPSDLGLNGRRPIGISSSGSVSGAFGVSCSRSLRSQAINLGLHLGRCGELDVQPVFLHDGDRDFQFRQRIAL